MDGRLFYGWVVVAATHVALFVIFGVAYSFAAFFSAFEREFDASRADVSLVFAISGFIYFLLGAFTGAISDRAGPRRVAAAGIVFLAAGLVAASYATSLPMLYATYSIGVGLGVGFVYVPAVGAVQPWFIRRRGLASGLAIAGIGLGTLVVPLVSAWLIQLAGWRHAFLILAAGSVVLGGIAVSLLDRDPARHGLYPDGLRATGSAGAPSQVPRGVSLREAAGTRAFRLLYASILFCSMGLFIPFVHLVPYARDAGLPETTGVLLMGLIGAGSLVGRFALAGFGDRFGRVGLLAALYGGMAITLAAWLALSSATALAVFALVFGTLYGAFVAANPPIAMDFFGARSVAGIIGVLYTAAGIGNLLGPPLAGLAYDASQSYVLPIGAAAASTGIAFGIALVLRRERPLAP